MKKKLTKEETKCFKMTEREIFKNFGKLSINELVKLCNKSVFVKNIIMTNIIKHCRGEKKRSIRSADGFRKKLMIPDYKVSVSIEHKVKSKIGTKFVNEDTLEEYSVKIYEIDCYFSENYEKRIQVDKNGKQYILFRIDIYFTKFCLAIEIDEKGHTDRDLIFEEKRQKALEKKLNCTFIRINTRKENFDIDYEASRIQTFISQFKDDKNKKLEDEIEKLKLQLANLGVKNSEVNGKKKEIIQSQI